tara:strand:+ start:1068 stop:1532 length:465 start_codon:yes stop_codon:yes gene_type:complete
MRKRRNSRSKGKIKNATAKTYKGIKFRSKLEVFTYKQLEAAKIKSMYEKNTYTLLPGFYPIMDSYEPSKGEYKNNTKKVRAITYTPDFVDPDGKWIIEVKGYANDVFPIKWKLFKVYLMENDMEDCTLYLPKNQKQVKETVELIKKLKNEYKNN